VRAREVRELVDYKEAVVFNCDFEDTDERGAQEHDFEHFELGAVEIGNILKCRLSKRL
jgi:hypothetical protein